MDAGYTILKFFPAEPAGGVPYLKALASPLPAVSFCPTGGVDAKNAAAYLALANVVCVGGSWVTPKDAVGQRRLAAHRGAGARGLAAWSKAVKARGRGCAGGASRASRCARQSASPRSLRHRPRSLRALLADARRPHARLFQEPHRGRDDAAPAEARRGGGGRRRCAIRCSPASRSTSPRIAPCCMSRCARRPTPTSASAA